MELEQLKQNIDQLKLKMLKRIDHIDTEETTKMSLISPFIRALGYDTEDPTEVLAEYTADVGAKKGEKIDYAIKKNGRVAIIVEAKKLNTNIRNIHANQLDRYFNCLDCRFGILTNGVDYHFYADLDKANKMDKYPFFTFNMKDYDDKNISELQRFTNDSFNEDEIIGGADKLKYTRALKDYLVSNYSNGVDDELFKFLFSTVAESRVSNWSKAKIEYGEAVNEAIKQFVSDEIKAKLKSAFGDNAPETVSQQNLKAEVPVGTKEPVINDVTSDKNILFRDDEKGIITTVEEVEAYHIVKSILRGLVSLDKVIIRDTKAYCGVLFEDNNRKPIARFHFNTSQKYLTTFDSERKEIKHHINSVDDIYEFADEIKAVIPFYVK